MLASRNGNLEIVQYVGALPGIDLNAVDSEVSDLTHHYLLLPYSEPRILLLVHPWAGVTQPLPSP